MSSIFVEDSDFSASMLPTRLICRLPFTEQDPSQPSPFSMPLKLLILPGEAKSYCLTVICVPESMFHYL